MIARYARRAVESTRVTLLLTVLCALVMLLIPVIFSLMTQHPFVMCSRFYSFEITAQSFEFTDDNNVIFRSGDTVLAAYNDERDGEKLFPDELIAQTASSDEDESIAAYYEIFDRLALVNDYLRKTLLPVILMVSVMCIIMLVSLCGILAGLMGLGRKFTHSLSFFTRLRVFAVSSWLPAIPCALLGFFIPVFHLFLYQIVIGFLAWRVQKLL